MNKNSFYITTTLPYVNSDPHIGFAMEIIRADVIARVKELEGYEVFFNTGTDEHGLKIFQAAEKTGINVQTYVDQYAKKFKELKELLNISSNVHFVRTTDAHHISAAQEFWKRCNDNGFIYKKTYQAKYCVGCELNKTDSELNEEGQCPLHPNNKIQFIDEENYFFKFSSFQKPLLEFYKKNPNFVIPDFRFHEIKSFVTSGLEDFSISRLKYKMPWGISVPGDDMHVMYVWFDALVNYISTLGWPEDEENFKKFWTNGTPVQYAGKDNLRQQSAMWQAMLMATGLPNTHQIVINGFITGEGGIKMSKSLGNVVDPKEIVKEYGTDALRYFLLREISSFEDSPFTMERFKEAYNAGLANGLGNLTSRIMKMAISYGADFQLFNEKGMKEKFESYYEKDLQSFNIKNVLDSIWNKIGVLDKKIAEEKPFELFKNDPEKAKMIVSNLVMFLDEVGLFLKPFLPETSEKIRAIIRERKMPETPLFLRKE